jgi:hypothetical protein
VAVEEFDPVDRRLLRFNDDVVGNDDDSPGCADLANSAVRDRLDSIHKWSDSKPYIAPSRWNSATKPQPAGEDRCLVLPCPFRLGAALGPRVIF